MKEVTQMTMTPKLSFKRIYNSDTWEIIAISSHQYQPMIESRCRDETIDYRRSKASFFLLRTIVSPSLY